MVETWSWVGVISSFVVVAGYELLEARAAWRDPQATARSAHRLLRGQWVRALSRKPGSEIVAVQALRNSLMSATITASTAALVLMGCTSTIVTNREAADLMSRPLSLPVLLQGMLFLALFASFVYSAMAMRYYHHAGFAMSLPVGSPERSDREPLAICYVQRGGTLYSWGLRWFLFAAPLGAGLLSPFIMPPAAVGLVIVLSLFDGSPRRIAS
jgi:hypothetical protein